MRLIDADSLEKTLRDWIRDHWTDAFTGDDAGLEFADMIEHEEAIERSPIAHAHWIPEYPNKRTGKAYSHTCSECGKPYMTADRYLLTRWDTIFVRIAEQI